MKWILTIALGTDLQDLRARLLQLGVEISADARVIPLDDSEGCVQASGPANLSSHLELDEIVKKVSPDSEMDYA